MKFKMFFFYFSMKLKSIKLYCFLPSKTWFNSFKVISANQQSIRLNERRIITQVKSGKTFVFNHISSGFFFSCVRSFQLNLFGTPIVVVEGLGILGSRSTGKRTETVVVGQLCGAAEKKNFHQLKQKSEKS